LLTAEGRCHLHDTSVVPGVGSTANGCRDRQAQDGSDSVAAGERDDQEADAVPSKIYAEMKTKSEIKNIKMKKTRILKGVKATQRPEQFS
jgi:hypothetical protein